jgi:DNA-binding MarR family transcriptional regulator
VKKPANREQLLEEFFETMSGFFRLLMANKEQLAQQSGANRSQFELLMRLQQNGQLTVGQVAEHMHITSSAATQLADSLVAERWVTKEPDRQDGRKVCLVLTKAGQRKVAEARRVFLQFLGQKLTKVSDNDIAQIIDHIQQVSRILNHTTQQA